MSETDNIKVVQDAYAAFGRGDVQGILDRLDDGIVWKGVYGAGSQVPMAGERRGKAAVTEFFKQVGAHVNFSRFEPREFVATGNKVVTLGHYTAKTSAGKDFDSDFAMVFTMRNGKVSEFQEFLNTAALNAAF
jgi:ketosteroid isomerase-like protein